jgi:endonuclease/exonuclease/phosphatase family metal-dependent hydrolase
LRKKVVKGLLLMSILLLLGSVLSPYVRPGGWANISVLGLFFPYIFIGSILVFIVGLTTRHWLNILLGLLLIYGVTSFGLYIQSPFQSSETTEGLTIMSYNAKMGHDMVNEKHVLTAEIKEKFDQMINKSPAPDIICGQEVSASVERLFSGSVDLPYIHKIENRGAVILSKYPFLKTGIVDFGAKLNSCLWADIQFKGQIIRIYSIHLESIRLNKDSYKMITEETYESENALNGIQDMIFKYHKYSNIRSEQVDLISKSINSSPYPVILCGDFNDPPMSYAYQRLSENLKDSFKESGAGIGSTWNGSIPLLRIDYILSNPMLETKRFFTIKSNLSDHYPIKAVFDLK